MNDLEFGGGREMIQRRWRWRNWLGGALVAFFLLWAGMVLLPPVRTVRGVANRVKCQNNLKRIGLAISQYAADFDGEYPDSLGTLLPHENISASDFICSETPDEPADGPTTQAIVDHLMDGGHMSYIYLGSGMKNGAVPAGAVIIYEPLSNHGGAGMNVLFGDNHVEFLDADQAAGVIAKAASTTRPVTMQLPP